MKRIGIPRALMYHRLDTLWSTFFKELGCEVVYSEETTRAIMEQGDKLSVDECCLASKIYLGHVANLQDKCDFVFVPSMVGQKSREGYCTKFQALPDLVANTFSEPMGKKPIPLLTCAIGKYEVESHTEEEAFIDLGAKLGAGRKESKRAYQQAKKAWGKERSRKAKRFDKQLAKLKQARAQEVDAAQKAGEPVPTLKPIILLVGHPYVTHDPYIGEQAQQMLVDCGAHVLLAEEFNQERSLARSYEFSKTMPWILNRELCGTIAELQNEVDGIVILSAFPCGPDSMTNEAVAAHITETPTLILTVDAQSGTAGLETRIESFVDILQFQSQGGYVHA